MRQADLQREVITLLPRLRRFARSLARNLPDADDLVQEACVHAIARADRFQAGRRLDSWMFTILRNEWISSRRKAVVRQGGGTVDAAEATELQHVDDGAAHLAAGQVTDAILALPEGLTAVIVLVSIEGYSYREAAEILDIPPGTVMSRMSRARQLLAAGLGIAREGTMS
jgi:RNA polymerase sigma-70 factor, ECF subfamily